MFLRSIMLPDGWEERESQSTRRVYFYNRSFDWYGLPFLRTFACVEHSRSGRRRYTGVSTWEIPSSPDAQAQSRYAPAKPRAYDDLTAVSTHQHYGSQGMGAPVPPQMMASQMDVYGASHLQQSASMALGAGGGLLKGTFMSGMSDYAMYVNGAGGNFGSSNGYSPGASLYSPYSFTHSQPLPYGTGGASGAPGYDQLKQTSAAWLSPGEHLASPAHPVTPFSPRSRRSSVQSSVAVSPNTGTYSQKYSVLGVFFSLAKHPRALTG